MPATAAKAPSVFHVSLPIRDYRTGRGGTSEGWAISVNGTASFDVAFVTFDDAGGFADRRQLSEAVAAIDGIRRGNENGAVVVLFIHGWHHNADWTPNLKSTLWDPDDAPGDLQFREFRRLLMRLALREQERHEVRNVVGVYLGWNGDEQTFEDHWLKSWTLSAFDNREAVARLVGAGGVLTTVRSITAATKVPHPCKPESPLVLVGHSMGALVLESAFLELLYGDDQLLIREEASHSGESGLQVLMTERKVLMPDLLLAINSAADSRLLARIEAELERRKVTKWLSGASKDGVPISYAPPLVISATSVSDWSTRFVYPLAKRYRRFINILNGLPVGDEDEITDGHDPRRWTHTLQVEPGWTGLCQQKFGDAYFGQGWHCLRYPDPPGTTADGPPPSFAVDLPPPNDPDAHLRYHLRPLPTFRTGSPVWDFEIPGDLVPGHGEIFGAGGTLLFMALIQIAGGVMSLARDIGDNFEAETYDLQHLPPGFSHF